MRFSALLAGLLAALALVLVGATDARAAGDGKADPLLEGSWSFDGVFGTFDRAALRRGFQVYDEVCSACHGMRFLHYRNLWEPGGPELSEEQVKAIAASKLVEDGPNADGEMFEREGRPRDKFVSPFPNAQAARVANNGALPPDLSLIVKATSDGANYVYSVFQGYADPPPGEEAGEGQHWNRYKGAFLAMAPPLDDDLLEYADGTPATLEQMSHDVATFLSWASSPHLEARRRLGAQVMAYLAALALVLWLATRRAWSRVHAREEETPPSDGSPSGS